jgi:uncharacterized protein
VRYRVKMLLTVDPHHHEVRRLLRLLRSPVQLEAEPLAAQLQTAMDAPCALDAVLAIVRKALAGTSDINQLMRGAVFSQDLDGNKARRVAASLGLSLRSYFRYRSTAIELIAFAIERELEQPRAIDESSRIEQHWRKKLKEALQMKPNCERCDTALPETADAFICSYECTFCAACANSMRRVCPNCGGELLARPRRGALDVRHRAS